MTISRVTNQGCKRSLARVITKVGRISIVGRITVRDGSCSLEGAPYLWGDCLTKRNRSIPPKKKPLLA